MDKTRFNYLYNKYLEDNCSSEECEELFDYINSSRTPHILHDLQQLKVDSKLPKSESDEIWNNILSQITVHKLKLKYFYKYSIIAASMLLIGMLTFIVWSQKSQGLGYKVVNNENKIINHKLEDGTIVHLKPGSSISFKRDFVMERNVVVNGEVFFDVAHDPTKPFNVKLSDDIHLKVLGTRFNVKTGTIIHDVVLTEGKVSVTNKNSEEILMPSERILIASSTMLKSAVDTLHYNSWINNQLYFNNTPLSKVISIMRIYYPDKNLSNKENLALNFTGYLPTDNYDLFVELINKTFKSDNIITN